MVGAFENIYNKLEIKRNRLTLNVIDNECSCAVKQFLCIIKTHWLPTSWSPQPCCQRRKISRKIHQVSHNCPYCNNRSKLPNPTLVQIYSTDRNHPQHTTNREGGSKKISIQSTQWQEVWLESYTSGASWIQSTQFLSPGVRNAWHAHNIDTWYVGPSFEHYHKMDCNKSATKYYTNSGTYELFLAHSIVPGITEGDRDIVAATNLLEMFKKSVPVSASQKQNHCKMLSSLTNVPSGHQSSRVSRWV